MTEYCDVSFPTWEPGGDYSSVIEYVFHSGVGDDGTTPPHLKDHLSLLSGSHRIQVSRRHGTSDDHGNCFVTLQCKPVCGVAISGLTVASEARTLELYDGKDGSYLSTVRGVRDTEDAEADDSVLHFMCHCALPEPLTALKIKFLSLGLRESFEIARIQVAVQSCPSTPTPPQGINMERLKKDIDNMGDTVSDRALAFLTTLEGFQKSKTGALDDMRHLLVNQQSPGSGTEGQSMAGITTLLSMFSQSAGGGQPSGKVEGSAVNSMLTQMMSSMDVGQSSGAGGAVGGGPKGDMHQFLQSVCSTVSQQRAAQESKAEVEEEALEDSPAEGAAPTAGELESRVTAQVEAMVESRLSSVEQHIKREVDQRMDEMETRMSSKLDAIFALLQSSQQK